MIPILHQGLHILALGPRGPTADSPNAPDFSDAPDFIAALAAQDDESRALTAAASAEACLAAGMAMPAQPILAAQPIPAAQPKAVALSDLAPAPTASPSTAIPASILATPAIAAAILPPQATAPQIIAPAQAVDQPTAQPTAINHRAMMVAPTGTKASPPQLRAISDQVSPNPLAEDQAIPQQILPGQTLPEQAEAALCSLPEQHPTTISVAESAWQTRLQVSVPTTSQPKPSGAPDRRLLDATRSVVDSQAGAIVRTEADWVDLKALMSPLPLAALASPPQTAESSEPRVLIANTPPSPQPAPATSARRSSGMAAKPTPDAGAIPNTPAIVPDLATFQPVPDQVNPQAKLVAAGPITPQQTVSAQALPPPLPAAIPAQLIRHLAAAQTEAVDVLLQPEELGHVKFQIQQHGESVRILLSAERPETLDLLRRHSDQLLQEFRQSGFSQASLSFGQWSQQQRSPAPPPELVALFDADFVEAPLVAPRAPPVTSDAASGQGLNLRL